jgi:pimeloyl-ACP methyl ester carboxylesterase
MPTVQRDGVRLAYERTGPAGGVPVVLVEGLGYGRWMWNWQTDALHDAGFETILPDNRGTGDSAAPDGPYTIPELAADLEAVLADADVDDVHLVGASMGGMIALTHVLEYDRAASLTLLSTSHGGEEAVEIPAETQARMYATPDGLDAEGLIRHRMAPALTDEFRESNPEVIERIVDWRLDSDAPDHAREAQGAAVAAFDVADRLSEVAVPTLVIHGTADRVVPVENGRQLAAGIPDAALELVDGGPHLVFITDAEDVNERLLEFLHAV